MSACLPVSVLVRGRLVGRPASGGRSRAEHRQPGGGGGRAGRAGQPQQGEVVLNGDGGRPDQGEGLRRRRPGCRRSDRWRRCSAPVAGSCTGTAVQLHGCTIREKCSDPRICSSAVEGQRGAGCVGSALRSLQSAPGTKFIASALRHAGQVALDPQQRAVGGGHGHDDAGFRGVLDQESTDDGQCGCQRMRGAQPIQGRASRGRSARPDPGPLRWRGCVASSRRRRGAAARSRDSGVDLPGDEEFVDGAHATRTTAGPSPAAGASSSRPSAITLLARSPVSRWLTVRWRDPSPRSVGLGGTGEDFRLGLVSTSRFTPSGFRRRVLR